MVQYRHESQLAEALDMPVFGDVGNYKTAEEDMWAAVWTQHQVKEGVWLWNIGRKLETFRDIDIHAIERYNLCLYKKYVFEPVESSGMWKGTGHLQKYLGGGSLYLYKMYYFSKWIDELSLILIILNFSLEHINAVVHVWAYLRKKTTLDPPYKKIALGDEICGQWVNGQAA